MAGPILSDKHLAFHKDTFNMSNRATVKLKILSNKSAIEKMIEKGLFAAHTPYDISIKPLHDEDYLFISDKSTGSIPQLRR